VGRLSLNGDVSVTKTRVVAAMSGGVDSCVAAALLLGQGYEVIGITMQLWNQHAGKSEGKERFGSCCSLSDVHDARVAAHALGIPHYVVNYEDEFKTGVVDYFAAEYKAGRTPNPCVMCNSRLKFDHLIHRAEALGADWVATGHYAQVVHDPAGGPSKLYAGKDPKKDQSYFLFDVRQDYLRRALFPLGGLTKPEVRQIARDMGIATAEKHESQEICFVTGKRYTDFLAEHYPEVTVLHGDIVSRSGEVLGRHEGIHLFTVGQRKGLGAIGGATPLYVAEIHAETRRVVVDTLENLKVVGFALEQPNWLVPADEVTEARVLTVAVRYHAKKVACRVARRADGTTEVLLAEPARWVTPGQAAVLYDDEQVIGGGFIARPAHAQPATIAGQRAVAGLSAPL
jgi:tRNA-specific 2-thiouridylase